MENPKVEKNYTTIFRDGSVIHENPWFMFPDGHGKWYWNEENRGGVVAWNEIPEGGYKYHKTYRLPDWELNELIEDAAAFEVINMGGKSMLDNPEFFNAERDKNIKDFLDYYNERYLIKDY